MPMRDHFRFDGLTIPVEIHGVGPPLLFLPGLGVHPDHYREGLSELAAARTVFVPDLSFRTHADLPDRVARYRQLVEDLAARYAPSAPRAGHSFGGFLALLGSAPAVALSPLVPVAIGWRRKVARAVRLQLREYMGFEGRRGVCWAWSIMREYVATAVRRPASLFPAVSETLQAISHVFRPTAPAGRIVLAEFDRLYHVTESESYLSAAGGDFLVRRVPYGHSWPVTRPALLTRELRQALADRRPSEGEPD